mgnify:FL=1
MRQVLANSFQEYQPLAGQAYKSGDLETFRTLSSRMLDIIKAQDKLLSSSDDFLVGAWIDDAARCSTARTIGPPTCSSSTRVRSSPRGV